MTIKAKKQRATVSLQQRREPIQPRAQASRDRILTVAGDLLEEVGIDDFNTNLLAERAGVLIRTVYRYFPNKFAVIATLGGDMITRWENWLAPLIEDIARPDSDLEQVLREMLEDWIASLIKEKGGRAILQALGAVPQLRELDSSLFVYIVDRYQIAITKRLSLPADKSVLVSNVIVSAMYGMVDCYFRVPDDVRASMPAEVAKMITGHLQTTLGNLSDSSAEQPLLHQSNAGLSFEASRT